ncbi:MAG: MFS transporter [Burkholderiales bacterium]
MSDLLPRRTVVAMFLSFALAYFLSAILRAVIATLAPEFSAELDLGAADLGLLAGAFFLGFASTQLPLGNALDRHGPKRVQLTMLALAVIGCALFASARSFAGLIAARVLIGMGVSACLMAPMTSFRRHLAPTTQVRAASWMLMTGSSGMVASTLPVQWMLPLLGWRGLFWAMAGCLLLSMFAIGWLAPRDAAPPQAKLRSSAVADYMQVFRHRTFLRLMPSGFFHYGGLIALQALWIGPWLSHVCGWSPREAAQGLFVLNVCMLLAFLSWGVLVPRLFARGWTAQSLMRYGVPLSLGVLLLALALGEGAGVVAWTLFCVGSTVVTLTLPTVGQAFGAALAGRALSAFNLVIFSGVFVLQWAIGGLIDVLGALGWTTLEAYRGAFGMMATGCILSYLWFLWFDDSCAVQPFAAAAD